MSLGIPTVASPVGVNIDVINEGKNGFLCDTHEEWLKALTFLLIKEENRTSMSESAIQKIKDDFSVLSNKDNFLSLFNI
jgi:glycosyltransferase involved in cell wall biosynthesis